MRKRYSINDFSPKDVDRAKDFIRRAMLGLVYKLIDEKVDDIFEQLKSKPFAGDDELIMSFSINSIGNDILAAIGAAELERKDYKPLTEFK